MKVENEMALPTTKSVAVMLLEPYAGKLARTVLRGESSRKGADLLDIYNRDVETGYLLSVSTKIYQIITADNKNAISKIKKRSSFAEIRHKYSYNF